MCRSETFLNILTENRTEVPFPYAQMTTIFLFLHCVATILGSAIIVDYWHCHACLCNQFIGPGYESYSREGENPMNLRASLNSLKWRCWEIIPIYYKTYEEALIAFLKLMLVYPHRRNHILCILKLFNCKKSGNQRLKEVLKNDVVSTGSFHYLESLHHASPAR